MATQPFSLTEIRDTLMDTEEMISADILNIIMGYGLWTFKSSADYTLLSYDEECPDDGCLPVCFVKLNRMNAVNSLRIVLADYDTTLGMQPVAYPRPSFIELRQAYQQPKRINFEFKNGYDKCIGIRDHKKKDELALTMNLCQNKSALDFIKIKIEIEYIIQ